MSMYQGLDLSRFKKLASDKKTTTLRHSKGHELKIAHSSLSPEMRTQIESLKCAQCDGVGCNCGGAVKMAKGGSVPYAGAVPRDTFEDTPHALIPDDAKVQTAFPRGSFIEEQAPNMIFDSKWKDYQQPPDVVPAEMTDSYMKQGSAKAPPSKSAYDLTAGNSSGGATSAKGAAYQPPATAAPTAAPTLAPTAAPTAAPTDDQPLEPTDFGAEPTLQETPKVDGLSYFQGDYMPVEREAPPDPDLPAKVEQHLNQQSEMFANELAAGHIHPKTISDLYGSKDTLGKIGMIFGLMVSGAGSGLAHQTNAALDLINKELDRDLEAQKASNTNAQSWYNYTLQHQRDLSQIEKTKSELPLIAAQARLADANAALNAAYASKVPADIQAALAAVDKARADAYLTTTEADLQNKKNEILGGDTSSSHIAKGRMMIGAGQHLQNWIDKQPPGPQKDNMQNVYDTQIAPAIGAAVTDKNNQVGAAVGAGVAAKKAPPGVATALPPEVKPQNGVMGALGPVPDANAYDRRLRTNGAPQYIEPKAGEIIDQNKLRTLIQKSKEMKYAGGIEPLTEREQELIRDDEVKAKAISNIKAAYNDSFTRLNKLSLAGKLNPEMVKAETSTLAALMARMTAGKTIISEMNAQSGGAFPDVKDWGGSAEQKYYKTMKMLNDDQKNTPTLALHPELLLPQPKLPNPFNHRIVVNPKTGERFYEKQSGKNKGSLVAIP